MVSRLLIYCILGLCCLVAATADTLVVAGRAQELAAPLIVEGTEVLAPVLPSLRLLGARATVDGKAVTITTAVPGGDRKEVRLTLGARDATAGGRKLTLPAAPREVDGEVYLPVRALASSLHAEARFDADARILTLSPLLTVTYEPRESGVAVLVQSPAALQYTSGALQDPPRLYFDFKHVGLGMADQQMPVNQGVVQRLRLSQNPTDGLVRLVVDVNGPAGQETKVSDAGRLATIIVAERKEPVVTPETPANPAITPPAAAPRGPVKLVNLTLTPQSARQTELAVEADGPVLVEAAYESKTRQLALTFPNGLNTLPADRLHPKGDTVVTKLEAVGAADKEGAKLLVTLKEDGGYLIERDGPVLRVLLGTFSIADMIIVLDAGHGAHDSGAVGCRGTYEKDINLDVVLRTEKLLRAAGAKVLLTRGDDTFIPLDDRPGLANKKGADLFISVHCNSTAVLNSATGTQTYYRTPQSTQFAAILHAELVAATKLKNGGVRTANFLVIRKSLMPSVLLELGFINNEHDEAQLRSPEFRQRVAEGIVAGIRRYAATKGWKLRRGERFDEATTLAEN